MAEVLEAVDNRRESIEAPVVDANVLKVEHVAINEGQKMKSLMAGLTMCLGSLAMGTVLGYPSPAVPNLNDHRNPFHVDSQQNSWIGSIITLGGLFGGLAAGPYMDIVGRKLSIMTCLVPFMIGWVIVEASGSFACLLAGRLVTGLCSGLVLVVVPVYLGEVAPPSIRGLLGSCHQLAVTIGILLAYCFGAFLPWNWLAVVMSAVPLIMMAAMVLMPETPRWLLSKGRKEDADEALHWLRGQDTDIGLELGEIEDSIKTSKDKASFKDFLEPRLWKPLAIAIGLMIFQQFSGTNVIMFYTVTIFDLVNSDLSSNTQTIIVGAVGVVGTLVSVFIADLAGRRILLLISAVVMSFSMAGMGAYFYEKEAGDDDDLVDSLSWLPITCLVLYNVGFNIAFGPIPWVMMGELFPLRAKGLAGSICTAINWLCAFFLTKFWVDITDSINDYGGYWMCCAFCVLAIPFVVFFVPETKGKTLEEIQENFG